MSEYPKQYMVPQAPSKGSSCVKPTSVKPEQFQSPFLQNKYTWLFALLSGVWTAFTIAYACAITSTTGTLGSLVPSVVDATLATRVLRFLSEGVTILLTSLLASSSSIAKWAAASSDRGITFSTWLSMSASTGWSALWTLFRWKSLYQTSRDFHRSWIISRLFH